MLVAGPWLKPQGSHEAGRGALAGHAWYVARRVRKAQGPVRILWPSSSHGVAVFVHTITARAAVTNKTNQARGEHRVSAMQRAIIAAGQTCMTGYVMPPSVMR